MRKFREPEIRQDNGRLTMVFYCQDPECGNNDHGLRILRLAGMDINICTTILPVKNITGLIVKGKKIYPPFRGMSKEMRVLLSALE